MSKANHDGNKYSLRIKNCGTVMADDGYKWRKYGQKSIKNSPNPRLEILDFFSFLLSHEIFYFVPCFILMFHRRCI